MKKILIALSALLMTMSAVAQNTFSFGTNVNPEGVKFEVDSHGFVIDGQHVLPVMGEIHYARVPEKEWRRELQKMKAGGITIIATYVFWIHHEAEEGKWDWNGNKNLRRFLEICKQENLPVVLRLGPFCHGEVYQGGFPVWLTDKAAADPSQYKLRSLAPGFMKATESLYNNIFSQAKGMLWKDGGPVVGVQIENECRGPWNYYMALKDIAVKAGFDTPFYTRTGWPALNGKEEFGKLLPLYGDYADGFWDRTLDDMPGAYKDAFKMKDERMSRNIATETFSQSELTSNPDGTPSLTGRAGVYPYLTCELGGGMMPSYHRRINISGYEAFPLAICKVGSGSNLPGYYMYHGGTNPYNPLHTMAETQATNVTNYNDMPYMTYDFQAPLGEMGQINENAFHQTRWFHQFLADWGEELSMMDIDSLSEHYARRGCFEFSNSYVRILNEDGLTSVCPNGMQWEGLTITSDRVQPFAKADGQLYFITVRPNQMTKRMRKFFDSPLVGIDGADYKLKVDKPFNIKGKTITVLSPEKAKTAFVIDGKMHYAENGGILYKDGKKIREEYWRSLGKAAYVLTQQTSGLRNVPIGSQKVAAMPTDTDFEKAAVWKLTNISDYNENLDLYLQISYRGDVARVYADGKLVEDNFWNGKPMLVRLSDLAGKSVEIKILPLGKDFPIYLQQEQRDQLQSASGDYLLSLDGVTVLERRCESISVQENSKNKVAEYKITDKSCQTIDGFGASDAWSMWQIGAWEDSLQAKVADWLFSSENDSQGNPKGIGLSIWRFNAGAGSATQGDSAQINYDTRTEYFENQTGQRRFLKLAKERGVPTFLAFFNTPPVSMTINGLGTNTGRGGTFNLKDDCYDDFARYAADMIQTAEKEDGIRFNYICPVNEPDGHWNWQGPKQEGTPATNREVARIAREFDKEFVNRGITTKILVNESSDYRCMLGEYQAGWQRGNEIQCFWNPDSADTYVGNLKNIAKVMAGHSYWTNTPVLKQGDRRYEKVGLYGYRKRLAEAFANVDADFWMTELCIMGNDDEIHGGSPYDFGMDVALYVARVMHFDLTVANARSWQWWRAAGGNYKDGLIRMYRKGERVGGRGNNRRMNQVQENMVRDSRLMWTLGNYSRFIRPGAVRLDVEGIQDTEGVMISAYKNADGSTIIVAINYSATDKSINITSESKKATAYRTSDAENETLKNLGEVNLKRTALAARSVTTFVCPALL